MNKELAEAFKELDEENEVIRYAMIVNQNTDSDLQVSEAIVNSLTPSVKHAPDERLYVLTSRVERDSIFNKIARGVNILFRKPMKVSEVKLNDMTITTKYLKFRELIQVHRNIDLDFLQKCR